MPKLKTAANPADFAKELMILPRLRKPAESTSDLEVPFEPTVWRDASMPTGLTAPGGKNPKVVGVVSLETLILAIHLIFLRGVVGAASKVYRVRVGRLKAWIGTWITSRVIIWKLGKEALKEAMKKLATIVDGWRSAECQVQMEDAIRGQGLRTMDELLGKRFGSGKPGGVGGAQFSRVVQKVYTRRPDK